MKKFLAILFNVVFVLNIHAQLVQNSLTSQANGTIYFYQFKPPHFSAANPTKYPLIISLHGGGQAGTGGTNLSLVLTDGLPLMLSQGATMEFQWQGKLQGFVVLAPQANNADWNTYYGYVDDMISYGINNLNVDPNRIFLTGYSLGGGGSWVYPSSSATAASKLAGIVPVASGPEGSNFCNIAQNQVATWAFHAKDDPTYSYQYTIDRTGWINACNGLKVTAVDTIYPDGGHGIWLPRVYDTTNKTHIPNTFQWMLSVNKSTIIANNRPPVAVSGGPSLTLMAPVKIFNLDGSGSYDPDQNDLIMDYLWEDLNNSTTTGLDPNRVQWPKVNVNPKPNNIGIALGIPAGIYNYRLRVKDYLSQTTYSTISIEVKLPANGHAAPATDAGPDLVLTPGVSTAAIIGQANDLYNGGGIRTYSWRQISGPAAFLADYNNIKNAYTSGANAIKFANMLVSGTYTFEFSAQTVAGDIGKDTVNILVSAQGPLPLTILNFSGHSNSNNNDLSWQTAFETNFDHFEIMRSDDGNSFIRLASLASKGGAFTANYNFEDKSPLAGRNYYKLNAVDKDGMQTFSPVISVNNNSRKFSTEKFPNPVKDNLTVVINGNLSGAIHIAITDMLGKILKQQEWIKPQGGIRNTINVSSLQSGMYQLMITFPDGSKEVSGFFKN